MYAKSVVFHSESDNELLARLHYYGMAHLSLHREEVGVLLLGLLLDLRDNGISKSRWEYTLMTSSQTL